MATSAKRRATASNIQLSIDSFIQLRVDLLTTTPTDKSGFKSICPECETPHTVSERYTCDENHGPFTRSELRKAREIDGALHPVTEDDTEAVKGTVDKEAPVVLHTFAADAVNGTIRPTGTSYILRPQKGNEKAYVAYVAALADTSIAVLGEIVVRGVQKLYRLETWNGQLVAQEQVRPDKLAPAVEVEASPTEDEVAMMKMLVAAKTTDFDPTLFHDARAERVAALDAQLASGESVPVSPKKVKVEANQNDLLAALAASLEASKA